MLSYFGNILPSLHPVSYTHLDVYKRQIMKQNIYCDIVGFQCLDNIEHQTNDLYLTRCGIQKCPSNFSWGPKKRPQYHMHFILDGEGYLKIDQETYHLKTDQIFLIPPNTSAPVSYTHLDVYKRQRHIRSPQIIIDRLWKCNDIQPFLPQKIRRLMRPVSSKDHKAIQVQLMVSCLLYTSTSHHP